MATNAALCRQLLNDPLFAPCRPDDVAAFADAAQMLEGRRGAVVAARGTTFQYLGFVSSGVLAASALPDAGVRGVHRLGMYECYAGSTFAEIAALDGEPLGEIIVMSSRASWALIPSAIVIGAARNDPALMHRLAVRSAVRCRELARRLIEYTSRPVVQRLAELLVQFVRYPHGMHPADPVLAEMVHRDLAAAAGCVKEAAARAIAELEDAGALRREHGRICYLHYEVLAAYARGADGRHALQSAPRRGESDAYDRILTNSSKRPPALDSRRSR